MGRRFAWALAALTLACASTAYGFLAHKHHLFPYQLGVRVHQKLFKRQPPPGWRKIRPDNLVPVDKIDQIANLPYLRGYRSSEKSGVQAEVRERIQDGWNLFTSGHAPVASLMGSDGRVVKSWTADVTTAFPGMKIPHEEEEWERYLNVARLYGNGDVVVMFSHIGLVRLDLSSRVVWAYPTYAHHDLDLLPDESLWVLSRQDRLVPGFGQGEPIVEDFVEQVSPQGKLLRKVSVLEALRQSDYAALLNHVAVPGRDLLHTNSVRVLDGSLAERSPAFRRGNLLLSMRPMDTIAILDPDQGKIVWALVGQWHLQHAARMDGAGRLFFFDNFGSMRAASRILELDPFTQQITWSWGAGPGQDLFSETSGRVQRLENGNTLICETNRGRALEVTRDGQVVWEWVNPNRAGKNNELVAALYFIERVPRNLPFLANPEAR